MTQESLTLPVTEFDSEVVGRFSFRERPGRSATANPVTAASNNPILHGAWDVTDQFSHLPNAFLVRQGARMEMMIELRIYECLLSSRKAKRSQH